MLRDIWSCASALLVFLGFLFVLAGSAGAQQPTQAQASAIRSSCRSDYRANCSEVPTGGSAALQCLEQNLAKLSAACQQAVKAAMPAAQPQQNATAPAKNKTPSAAEAAPATAEPSPSAQSQPAPAPAKGATAAAPAKGASAGGPSSAQAAAIKTACSADFPVHCPGVKPGGSTALQCLKANAASLSQPCQQAVLAAGGGGASASTATSKRAAAKAPATGQPKPVAAPAISVPPRQALFALRTACAGDVQSYCSSVPLGGGRALACLGAHSASLSPACKAALNLR